MKTETIAANYCAMCGAMENDVWETETARRIVLRQQRRFGDESQLWILCDEGMLNAALSRNRRDIKCVQC